jgi:NitT/TauT family transport system permease protein
MLYSKTTTTTTTTTTANKIQKKNRKFDITSLVDTFLFIAVFSGIWQLIFLLKIFPTVSLPSPFLVGQSIVELIQNSTLFTSVGTTFYRLAIGFGLSIIIGLAIGLVMTKFPGFGKTMGSFAVGLQTFPSVAWVPFAILLVGLTDLGILFVVVLSSTFSIMTSIYGGLRNIPPLYIKAAKNMGANGFSLFRYVMIPAATPSILVGIKQAWSFAWHALIGAEILMAASIGLGHVLLVGREFQAMDQTIAAMITIFIIGWVFDRVIFSKIEERVREKWGLNQNEQV